ncbi:MAG: nuclear transport factor 2 family protein, partial [Bacteroidales bacterium]|nr:nuclear transport factor 2 family protein [Bacteroidales bacterium]
MKKLLYLTLLLPLMMGCSSIGDNSEKNIALVEKYIAGVENLDYDIMGSILADDYLGLGPSYGDSIGKAQALENWKFHVETLYELIEYQRSRNTAVTITTGDNQGEWVSNWAELYIEYKNDRGAVTIWANTIYRIENNKIVKSYTFYNEADALRQ